MRMKGPLLMGGTTKKMPSLCSSCSINKVHQHKFHPTSLKSNGPLDLIYINVWGPAHIIGLDSSHYYLLFVDHYTKYMWFFPMATKSNVSSIFPQFKPLVKNHFNKKIKTLYSNNGGEFVTLIFFWSHHGITYYTIASYTTQQNEISECRHCYLVETGLMLLHDASLPLSFWPHAFCITTYLINCQPTPLLHNKSPFELLFG